MMALHVQFAQTALGLRRRYWRLNSALQLSFPTGIICNILFLILSLIILFSTGKPKFKSSVQIVQSAMDKLQVSLAAADATARKENGLTAMSRGSFKSLLYLKSIY